MFFYNQLTLCVSHALFSTSRWFALTLQLACRTHVHRQTDSDVLYLALGLLVFVLCWRWFFGCPNCLHSPLSPSLVIPTDCWKHLSAAAVLTAELRQKLWLHEMFLLSPLSSPSPPSTRGTYVKLPSLLSLSGVNAVPVGTPTPGSHQWNPLRPGCLM